MRALAHACCLLAAMARAAPLAASGVYRWTDDKGVTQYGDRPPEGARAAEVHALPVRAEPGAIARLRVDGIDGRFEAWADNRLAGPIEVMLHFSRRANFEGEPALPARATVAAGGSTLVSRLSLADPSREGTFELRLDAVPGDPSAKPRDVVYRLPLQASRAAVDQGFGGRFSHDDPQNLHAVDFAVPVGTPVLAARDGTVMQVEGGFDRSGLDRAAYATRANFVRILHGDGTMALYAHLRAGGVLVRVGQAVRAGDRIGLSGDTGFATGPHLHFVVQVNRGMRLESLPFRMLGPAGLLDTGRAD